MSYNKTTWSTGDTITAEKLNKIEDGVANSNGVFYINVIEDGTDPSTFMKQYSLSNCTYDDILAVVKDYVGDPDTKPVALITPIGMLTEYTPANYTGQPRYEKGIEFFKYGHIVYSGQGVVLQKESFVISDDDTVAHSIESVAQWAIS